MTSKPISIGVAFLLLGLLRAPAADATPPKVGEKAPAVVATDQDGKAWKLGDFEGKKMVLLYFYPKDDTPGCTKEACGFRDQMDTLKASGVEVAGVSFDNAESHKKFAEKHSLNFTLLPDPEGKIADAYGARMQSQARARRVSFLIGKDGRVLHVTDSPNAEVHLSEMKQAIEKEKAHAKG